MIHGSALRVARPLTQIETLRDALQIAMDFELSGFGFYSDFADQVDSEVRPVMLELAAAGKLHHGLLRGIAGSADIARRLTPTEVLRLAAARRRSPKLPDLESAPIEDDVLNYAEIRERRAYEYYGCLLWLMPQGPLRELIDRLKTAKQRHQEQIRSSCAALFLIF